MTWARVLGSLTVATLAGVTACSSSYVTSGSDGGSSHDASDDAADAIDDAGSCTEVPATVPPHGGPACPSDASTCYPADVTGFTPVWVPPLAGTPHAKLCTQTQISDALKDCIDGTTETNQACQAWLNQAAVNATCYGCLVTEWTAGRYGAAIQVGGILAPNVAACIALSEPCNLPCAKATQATMLCGFNACNPVSGPCAATDTATYQANQACSRQADSTCGCAAFSKASIACIDALQADPSNHPAVGLCDALEMTDFDTSFTAIATLMCGE
jgi:hypothetical protein